MMTKMGAKLAEQSDQIAELTAQVAALSIKPEKQEKPVTTFAGLYGALMLNEDGSGKRFRHIAELKNGEDDEWFATWDAKNSVLAQEDSDAVHESFGEFGSNGGWGKVKFYDMSKLITASTSGAVLSIRLRSCAAQCQQCHQASHFLLGSLLCRLGSLPRRSLGKHTSLSSLPRRSLRAQVFERLSLGILCSHCPRGHRCAHGIHIDFVWGRPRGIVATSEVICRRHNSSTREHFSLFIGHIKVLNDAPV